MTKLISAILQKASLNGVTTFVTAKRMRCNYPDNYYGDQICAPCRQQTEKQ